MTRFIEITKPKIAIIENVLTVRRAKSEVVQRTIDFLGGLGYGVEQQAIRGIDLGLPQDRRRHFTIATLGKLPCVHSIIEKRMENPRNVMWAINDLREVKGVSTFETSARHQIQNRQRIAWLFGENWDEWEIEKFNVSSNRSKPEAYNLPNHRRPKCHQDGHNYPAVYGRMYPNLPSPTITTGFGSTGQGRFVHPFEQRSLTPHEAARVQGFPDFFDFSTETGRVSLQTLIGNAVPPVMSQHVVMPLLSMFENGE
jgi:DNA (cytosine-5)-methyltransferase 1